MTEGGESFYNHLKDRLLTDINKFTGAIDTVDGGVTRYKRRSRSLFKPISINLASAAVLHGQSAPRLPRREGLESGNCIAIARKCGKKWHVVRLIGGGENDRWWQERTGDKKDKLQEYHLNGTCLTCYIT